MYLLDIILNILKPAQIHAQDALGTDPPFTFEQPPAFSITSIGEFLGATTQLVFILAGLLAFAYLTWGGIQWLISGGDQSQVQTARNRINAALIGLAIVALGLAITMILQTFFGIIIIDWDNTGVIPRGF